MRMVNNIEYLAKFIPTNTVKMFHSLAKVHRNRVAEIVAKEINDLKPGETFAMFIRRQNCAIMIHRQSSAPIGSNDMIVSTFPGRVHPDKVYDNPSDLEVIELIFQIKIILFF